ncbi:MAG: GNAT family N-acetyltransferase [Scytonema sp. CRU_2_7]|nr:GNAT family N-acetyltransferase [Scytonema sp. CRU_2_7]
MILNIRNLTEADIDLIEPMLMAAYGESNSFQSELRRYLILQPDGWLVAESENTLIGMVGAVDYGAFAYIGMMAVDPAFQRQGVAKRLMKQLLDWLDGRGCPLVLLDATEVGAKLYTQFGFVEDEPTLVFQQIDSLKSWCSDECVQQLNSADLARLTMFDAQIFGADRQAVFATFLAEIPERALFACNVDGQITGYLFAQASTIGPWVASTPELAEALLASALNLSFSDIPQVFVPGCNKAATSLLMRYGFSKQRVQRHMRRGNSTPLGQRCLLYGLASLSIG